MPQRKPGAAGGGPACEPTLVVGPEVLGRKIMVFVKAANDFVSGTIVGFDPKTGACPSSLSMTHVDDALNPVYAARMPASRRHPMQSSPDTSSAPE
jgi:hypothetical protein